ncbi:CORVET complex subunit VPS3 [Kluyveromyces lactis]|uniref:KLLA0C12353p n=1 Tax=Kluyveromyces lactis (strain ATCC 8585 / CBS 2359 / DSM 70799 / NBRC 1267 / NRRL Y-1140 / WM37) TaxID=284590 RepID=Q6CTJ0_KLULA|nr:uncharacterized protein KLLA0_C12353g [Kluyveromyces lactis]CAH01600.1 KLLA0C12353p [Kluyveromyces lactis]|eukprot:XP_452749.1 uncharacterized protein KLLA0_C12353g [Kluyveromyces lactis]
MNDDTKEKPISTAFEVTDGLYAVSPLIENVPHEYEYSCIEYYGQHIYLGSTSGALLHYYELDVGNFTLISEVNFNEDRPTGIDGITLLPKIDRALVLSEGRLKMFLLPEFAPASNIPSIMNITELSLLEFCEKTQCYSCFLYTKNLVKRVSITSKEIKVEQKYNIKRIRKAIPSKDAKLLMAAVDNSYSIIHLENELVTPLFKVSETDDEELSPIVTNFGKSEYIVTCGISNDQNCMGLILNDDGEITHGTVVIENYPLTVIVDNLYVLSELHGSKCLQIHLIKENNDPVVIQNVRNQTPFHITKLQTPFITRQFNKELIEKLRYVPLIAEELQFREEQEKAYVARQIAVECHMIIYGKCGIYSLCRKPFLLTISSYGEDTLPILKSFITEESQSNYQLLQKSYLQFLYVLLLTLHMEHIDKDLIDAWLKYIDVADIRVLIYLLGFDIYGDLWIPNGLLAFSKKLHSLKLVHKCNDVLNIIQYLKFQLKETCSDSLKDSANVYLSLDLILLRDNIAKGSSNVDEYEATSYQEIAKELSKHKKEHSETLIAIYEKTKEVTPLLEILRQTDQKRLINYLNTHFQELPDTYSKEMLTDDISSALKDYNDDTVSDVLQLINNLNLDVKRLISSIEDPDTKVLLLEKLGASSTQDLTFLYEYYKAKLTVLNSKLIESSNLPITEYITNMTYNKSPFKEYLKNKLGEKKEYEGCFDVGTKLLKIEKALNIKEGSIIDDIDASFVLRIMITDISVLKEKIGFEKLLDIYLSRNDFATVESLLQANDKVVLKVIDHYLSLNNTRVISQFLNKNTCCINDSGLLIEILEKIPPTIQISVLSGFLFPLLRRKDESTYNLQIKKGILRHRTQNINNIERCLEL